MGRECTDPQLASLLLDPVKTGNPADVDDRLRLREPQLHHRQERVPAGQRPHAAVDRQQLDRLVEAGRPVVRELRWTLCVHGGSSQLLAASIARHTRSGVNGMSTFLIPSGASASITAFTTAGVEAIVPVSPAPFTPSGLTSVGVTVRSSSITGTKSALGTGYSIMLEVRSCPFSS